MRLRTCSHGELEYPALTWFNRLEMKAKGHPLSRVARQV